MLYTVDHPDAKNLLVLNPLGEPVRRLKSLCTTTGQAERYATDPQTGRVKRDADTDEALLERVVLASHTIRHRSGELLATTPTLADLYPGP